MIYQIYISIITNYILIDVKLILVYIKTQEKNLMDDLLALLATDEFNTQSSESLNLPQSQLRSLHSTEITPSIDTFIKKPSPLAKYFENKLQPKQSRRPSVNGVEPVEFDLSLESINYHTNHASIDTTAAIEYNGSRFGIDGLGYINSSSLTSLDKSIESINSIQSNQSKIKDKVKGIIVLFSFFIHDKIKYKNLI